MCTINIVHKSREDCDAPAMGQPTRSRSGRDQGPVEAEGEADVDGAGPAVAR